MKIKSKAKIQLINKRNIWLLLWVYVAQESFQAKKNKTI